MWRAVGVLIVFGLVWSSNPPGGASVFAQGGYAGEGGPQVPMPPTGNARKPQAGAPKTPPRKPRKPPPRARTTSEKKNTRTAPTSQSERDKHLCKALQACRNEFVRCKSMIKHPDQSEAWSIAKEECGAIYKTCVEKDFKSGEWFFTRWFYFKELDCS